MFQLLVLMLAWHQPLELAAEGIASYYTVESSGKITASGEPLRNDAFTCAMKGLPLGSYCLVVAENGNSVVCRVNDRGPHVKGRVIDLTEAAMRRLHATSGTLRVKVYRIKTPDTTTLMAQRTPDVPERSPTRS